MKILMLCDAYFEGLQYQENLLNKYYQKAGHDVIILSSNFKNVFDYYAEKYEKNNAIQDTIAEGARIIKLPFQYNILNKLRKLKFVEKYLEEIQPDIIYIHDIHLNILDAVKYKKENPDCKIIMDYHADYSNSGKNWLSINILHKLVRKQFFLKKALNYLDKIYYVVPASALFLNEIYSVPYEKMELLPLGVDYDLAREIKQNNKRDLIREQLSIPTEGKVIFTGGKINPIKNTHLLLEALKLINDPRYHLIVVGTFAKDQKDYEELVRNLAKSVPNIHFIGWVEGKEVYEYMAASDIAVFPSSQSVLWQQALSMSLPLVLGEAVKIENGKIYNNDVDYLNLRNNIYKIKNGELSAKSLAEGIQYYFKGNDLKQYRANADFVTDEMLDYNKIVKKTLAFS